mmetsp:Transcript_7047/g.20792  ORF Transcript_7047/g.20792 Transcript_7047/m.20792 type:complete len:261 (-) Transcript_7047:6-788(-)
MQGGGDKSLFLKDCLHHGKSLPRFMRKAADGAVPLSIGAFATKRGWPEFSGTEPMGHRSSLLVSSRRVRRVAFCWMSPRLSWILFWFRRMFSQRLSTLSPIALMATKEAIMSCFWGSPRSFRTPSTNSEVETAPSSLGSKVSKKRPAVCACTSKSLRRSLTWSSSITSLNCSFPILNGSSSVMNMSLVGVAPPLARSFSIISTSTRSIRIFSFFRTNWLSYCLANLRLVSLCFRPEMVESTKMAVMMLNSPNMMMIMPTQ